MRSKNMPQARLVPLALVLAGLWLGHSAALAQSGTKTLGGKSNAGGKVMTRDELRVCIQQQDELARLRPDIEARRAAMNKEREGIEAEVGAIKADQAEVDRRNAAVRDYNTRMNDYVQRVNAYNAAMAELEEDTRGGAGKERKRRELGKEKIALEREAAANQAEGDKIREGLSEMVANVNRRISEQGRRAADWNARNKALEEEGYAYEDKRLDWAEKCSDRRFREEDEKAIRAGK